MADEDDPPIPPDPDPDKAPDARPEAEQTASDAERQPHALLADAPGAEAEAAQASENIEPGAEPAAFETPDRDEPEAAPATEPVTAPPVGTTQAAEHVEDAPATEPAVIETPEPAPDRYEAEAAPTAEPVNAPPDAVAAFEQAPSAPVEENVEQPTVEAPSAPESVIEPALRAFENIVQEADAPPPSLDALLGPRASAGETPAAATSEKPLSVEEEPATVLVAAEDEAPLDEGASARTYEAAAPEQTPEPDPTLAAFPVESAEAAASEHEAQPVLQAEPELTELNLEPAEDLKALVDEPEPEQPHAMEVESAAEPDISHAPEIPAEQQLVAFEERPAIADAPATETEPEAAAFAAEDEAPTPAHALEVPEAPAAPPPEVSAPKPEAPTDKAPAPPNYFRAAGDPDDQDEEPRPSFWERQRVRLEETARRAREKAKPKLTELGGNARAVGGEVLRRVKNIRHPRSVREAAIWSGWAAAAGILALVSFFFFVTWGMPSTDDLWEARNGQSVTYLDRRGNVILREGAQNAPPVDLDTLPPYVAQAFIAIEDRRFYQHWGVDIGGMMRAGALNLRAGRVVQGGSTITQQLAKNLFLTNERSWRRKTQEIAMAIWLERRFSKREILALYLSRVYFGAGAYGVEAAAERYFDRPARELTLLQSAMIAGLVKAPSRLNPARQDIAAARARAEVVLTEMVAMGFISDAERHAAMQEELVISRRNPAGVLSYYRDWIDPLLNEVIGTQRDDFIVETTLDIAAQRAGVEAVDKVLEEQGQSRRVSQGALVSLDDQGGVIAMVGGRDYEQSQFNRATQARRQPGSSFKYFIYLAAMENGLTPWSIREDAPITIHIEGQPDWSPGNYHEEYNGPVELARAFAQSYNMVAIRVANEVGGQNVIDVAHRLGVRSELHNYHSLALGAQEVSLLEITGAYGAMASQGYRVEPHGVVRIRRGNSDETMWSWRQRGGRERVIEERPLRYMNYMMNRVVEAGTGTRARMPGRQIGGKTGTGNDYRDAWFIGFTPGIVTGVWVGNDNFTETARVVGGSLPADIWARFMPTALRNIPARDLEMPGPEDYDIGVPNPDTPALAVVGAPLGSAAAPSAAPEDAQDRSLDFGPEG